MGAATTRPRPDTTAAHEEMQSWWDETRSNIHGRFEAQRAKREEHRAERDLQKAKTAPTTPSWMPQTRLISGAYAIDEAEYTVVDAVIARADADDLASQQS